MTERWGWELRTPEPAVPTPFDEDPPAPVAVDAPWSRRLAATRAKVVAGWYAHLRRWSTVAVALLAVWVSTLIPWTYAPFVTLALVAAAAFAAYFAIRPLALPWWGDLRYRHWRGQVLERQREVAQRTEQWTRRRAEHQGRLDAEAEPEKWAPLKPMTTHRVDIYGGDPLGTQALLLSVAGSILESGGAVTVADLSQDGTCHALVQQAIQDRRKLFAAMLPQDMPALGLLDGLEAEDIGAVVAEAVHVSERSRDSGGDRTLDGTLIEKVAGCLRGAVTFTRLYEALNVATSHDEPRPEGIAREEYADLSELFGDTQRGALDARLFRLSAALQRLAALEPTSLAVDVKPYTERSPLVVWDLSERVGDVAGELLSHVAFQVLLHRLRHERFEEGRVLIVLGADRFRREHMERMDQVARRRGVRLAFFFRHLREDAVELLGGGEAVMFMRLGNAKEAEQAATFIGRDHRLVLSQFTVQQSSSLSTTIGSSTTETASEQQSLTKGKQWSRTRNYKYGAILSFPHDAHSQNRGQQSSTTTGSSASETTGTSESEQTGTSESRSTGYQRVYEFVVEPRFLQSLSSTSFVLVDPRDPGSPRIGDASPELDNAMHPLAKGDQIDPRKSMGPLSSGSQGSTGGSGLDAAAREVTADSEQVSRDRT